MYDELQNVRVQYRWQVIKEGNRLRKEVKRSRYLLFKSPTHWTETQRKRTEILFSQYDNLKQFYYLSLQLGQMYSTDYDKDVPQG